MGGEEGEGRVGGEGGRGGWEGERDNWGTHRQHAPYAT